MWLPAAWLLLDVNKLSKDAAVQFLYLIGLGRLNEGLRFFASDCKTHNPCDLGGMDALIDAMIAVLRFTVLSAAFLHPLLCSTQSRKWP
jgi:hypothetical protein